MDLSWLSNLFDLRWGLVFTLLFCFIYHFILKTWWYFERRNVKFVRGVPLLGSFYRSTLMLENPAIDSKRQYDRFPNERFIGVYEFFGNTSYMLRDVELIKNVNITHFDHFVNHRFHIDEDQDPLMGRSLFIIRDGKWRKMRSKLSPAYTGAKMKLMHSLILETTHIFNKSLGKVVDAGTTDFEAKDLLRRYASDVIGSCAFGIEVDSMENKDNEFYKVGVDVSNFSGIQGLKFLGYMSFPSIMKFFNITFLSEKSSSFIRSMVLNNIDQRIKNKIVRNDMIDLLIQARDGKLSNEEGADEKQKDSSTSDSSAGEPVEVDEKLTDDDVIAQCVLFFLAGFDTVAGVFAFLFHELAINPDIQDKLYDEICNVKKELPGGKLVYSSLSKLKYIDMVISESMRRYSPGPINERIVTKSYIMENTDGTKVQLDPGDGIYIPTYALHMDEKFFPNPEKFDPERFSDENKGNIVQGSYMPFGIGPRACIASRFALMELKTNLFYTLSNFVVERSARTQDPLKLTSTGFEAEKGFWIKLTRRQ